MLLSFYFNPRSSCEERHFLRTRMTHIMRFQSTLLMRGATILIEGIIYDRIFQSTLLMRGATSLCLHNLLLLIISIHAPHARSDLCQYLELHRLLHFNPRSSCEERRVRTRCVCNTLIFQSTLLMRGATVSLSPIKSLL